MPIDLTKVNLDAPSFGPGATVLEPKENATAEGSKTESGAPQEPVSEPASGGSEPVVEEQTVPYSRLKSVIEARRQAEQRAEEAEAALAETRQARQSFEAPLREGNVELPTYWVKLFGDDERSQEAYKYELQRQESIREEARREAVEAVRQERAQEGQVLSQNERTIDNRLEDLATGLGRDISSKEQDAILDIVDEYTPKDEEGNYAGELMSFDKAWEIYELRQTQAGNKVRQARSVPTGLTSARTEGEPNTKQTDDANWNPLDWRAYEKRLPKS